MASTPDSLAEHSRRLALRDLYGEIVTFFIWRVVPVLVAIVIYLAAAAATSGVSL